MPVAAWKALYPRPYEATWRREAARMIFDHHVAAGLFARNPRFRRMRLTQRCLGLMQVLPKTGKLLAKQAQGPLHEK